MAKKILIVDDEPNIVKMVESRLKASGYEVITAFDGPQCLDKVKAEIPDLVILDLMLPQMSGYDVCHTLRSDKEHKNIPIIMLTARGKADDIRAGMEKGADAYVAKPFNPTVLLGIIEGLLGK
jgi:DNA-binding response OmpR family regulator